MASVISRVCHVLQERETILMHVIDTRAYAEIKLFRK